VASGLASVYMQLGKHAFEQGTFGDAVRHHSRAMALARATHDRNPAHRQYVISLAYALGNLGEAHRRLAQQSADPCQTLIRARSNLAESLSVLERVSATGRLLDADEAFRDQVVRSNASAAAEFQAWVATGRCQPATR
jgi:hypothetical protein